MIGYFLVGCGGLKNVTEISMQAHSRGYDHSFVNVNDL